MGHQKSEIDRDEVRKIIKALKVEREKFESGDGNTFDLQQNGNITMRDLGTYPAGQVLSASTSAAYTQISGQYQAFLSSYDKMIAALERMVANHDEKEQTNSTAVYGVISGSDPKAGRRDTPKWGGS
ncbi:hypothetical protein [Actinomadura decatromicini]|uniref:Uncharacterized protein n=1 Tax=Actinomadura decatromicini TaxID=2604572 RepID=A0A5D3F8N1_9ACTN|nr:hypothetical protein [Actinomadura decatromicini]TYK43725.1 hypothetical protein FXF68_36875 [Actinomadura decatromicini]